MKFTSLKDAFSNEYIKSLPHLTRLELTANEIKIIELVLSFTRIGKTFYMNHSQIAERLVLGNTKHKAKIVGNIIRELKNKGFLNTVLNHNYNGKNGGSSLTILVDEVFLEQKLIEAFNPNLTEENVLLPELITNQIIDQTSENFILELEAMEDLPATMPNFPPLLFSDENNEQTDEVQKYNPLDDFQDLDEAEFQLQLQKLIRTDLLSENKLALQMLIDNPQKWKLEYRKGGLKYLIDESKEKRRAI